MLRPVAGSWQSGVIETRLPNIYLDHQSATPLLPEVAEAMRPFLDGDAFGNASSLHQHGLLARDAIAQARDQVAAFVLADSPEDILFTSDGTESLNLAVKGSAWANERRGRHIVASAIEHPAVSESVAFLEKHGFQGTQVPVNHDGLLTSAAVADALTDDTILACVHQANHDIGAIQPIAAIGEVCADRGVPLLVDGEAAAGWLPLNAGLSGVGLLAFSPHRFGGPKGIGVLCRHRRARLVSLLHGGIQEGGFRAGIENVAAIVGAGAACALLGKRIAQRAAHAARLQQRLWDGIRARIPYVKLNGPEPGPDRLGAALNVSFEFVEGEGLLLMLDTQGIAVASGTSCVSKALKVSPVLKAIGLGHTLAQGSVLFSFSETNSDQEIDVVLTVLEKVVAKLRGLSPMWDEFERGLIDSILQPRQTS